MQLIDGRFIYSASDLNDYGECAYLTALERDAALGARRPPLREDPTLDLLARKGAEHERVHLERLREHHAASFVAFEERPSNSLEGLRAAEAATVEAMERGVELIYQATFFDGTFVARADFLRRVDSPSARWPWSYEVVDTKLALAAKPKYVVQLAHYSEHLARIQGSMPASATIVLGSGNLRTYRLADFAAYYRYLKERFTSEARSSEALYPDSCSYCATCAWEETCETRRSDDDHLSRVAGIRADQIAKLTASGITTLSLLAGAPAEPRPHRLSADTFAHLRAQAGEQRKHYAALALGRDDVHSYRFRAHEAGRGFTRLPRPDPGDIFFDMEGDPLYSADRGLEYLFGVYLPLEDRYVPMWATSPHDERAAFERFVDFVVERLQQHPQLHVYHYAPYEMSALKRLMGQFGSREAAIDSFIRAGTFVDLFPVVIQSMWLSQPSYSIKKVEALYGRSRSTLTKGGEQSIAMFETWLATGDGAILEDIRAYNEDDCRSTYELREWLLQRRSEFETSISETLPWYERPEDDAEKCSKDDDRSELERRLLRDIDAPQSLAALRASDDGVRARWILGTLMQFHRRDDKPQWWEYFRQRDNIADLIEFDDKALGGLVLRTDIEPVPEKSSLIHTFYYPPQQFTVRGSVTALREDRAATIVSIDEEQRMIRISIGKTREPHAIEALAKKPIGSDRKARAFAAVAQAFDDGLLARDFAATHAMLLRSLPRFVGRAEGSRVQPDDVSKEQVSLTIAALDASYLFVQGPPGTGKTTAAAWAAVDLLRAGKRVAVATNSHKAAHNLMAKIEQTAHERSIPICGLHRSTSSSEHSEYEGVVGLSSIGNTESLNDLESVQLASTTTTSWADERFRGTFDYVFIDEAGQVSLADALYTSLIARNVVLFGDPMQLPQVSAGSHPVGGDLSALEHLLGGAHTVSEKRGVFLETSYRLHPQTAAFLSHQLYDGRLRSLAENERSAVVVGERLYAGLGRIPVEHAGNKQRSPEEGAAIADAIEALLRDGEVQLGTAARRSLRQDDILVVAPYNAQRLVIETALRERGFPRIRVGTVDKFQGQEAPVVFYSMTASSGDDIARGSDFLFDENRFNVAISRSQALSVLVNSPQLLATRPKTIETMKLVNLLCAYVESASVLDIAHRSELPGALGLTAT